MRAYLILAVATLLLTGSVLLFIRQDSPFNFLILSLGFIIFLLLAKIAARFFVRHWASGWIQFSSRAWYLPILRKWKWNLPSRRERGLFPWGRFMHRLIGVVRITCMLFLVLGSLWAFKFYAGTDSIFDLFDLHDDKVFLSTLSIAVLAIIYGSSISTNVDASWRQATMPAILSMTVFGASLIIYRWLLPRMQYQPADKALLIDLFPIISTI